MSLSEREILALHLGQLGSHKSIGKLEMNLGTAINYILMERCSSLSFEEFGEFLHDAHDELEGASETYNKHNIR